MKICWAPQPQLLCQVIEPCHRLGPRLWWKSQFSLFYSSPIQGWGLEGIQRLDGNKILTVHRVKFTQRKPFPGSSWEEKSWPRLVKGLKQKWVKCNCVQLLKDFWVYFTLWAWLFLHDNSIICKVLILKSIYLNDLLCSEDERAALQIKDYSSFCKSHEWNFSRIDNWQFFCQQLHKIKWCNSPYPLPLASANLLLAITEGSNVLNRQEVDEQNCKCSPSNAAQSGCNHWPL